MTRDEQETVESPGELKKTMNVRNVSLTSAIFNLTKSAVGVGTLYLHARLYRLGFGLGLAVLLLAATMSTLSLHLLSRLAHNCGTGDYFVIGKQALGRFGELSTSVALLLFLLAALIYYCFFAGKYLQETLDYLNVDYSGFASLTYAVPALLCMFPLACLRDLSALSVASVAGMVSMIGVMLLVVYYYFTTGEPKLSLAQAFAYPNDIGPAAWGAFGGIIFAFVNHFTVVSLMPVLQRPTAARRACLNVASTLASLLVYLPCAVCGYLMFKENPKVGSLLSVENNVMFAIARAVVGCVVMLSFPLLLDPARSTLAAFLPIEDSPARHYGLTFGLTFVPLLVVLKFGNDCDGILSLISAMCGSILVFIAPPIFFLSLQGKMVVHGYERISAYALLVFGLIALVTGTYSSYMGLIGK